MMLPTSPAATQKSDKKHIWRQNLQNRVLSEPTPQMILFSQPHFT